MKLIVIGVGQGGSNIADEFVGLGKWIFNNRGGIRIFSGKGDNPAISRGVFAVNLADGDMRGMKNIPTTDDYSILLGTTDEKFRGRGTGKVNFDGAEQARIGKNKILNTIDTYSDVPSADAIFVIATTAGGTGSGAVGVIVDMMKDRYPVKPVYAILVLPFEQEYAGDDPDSDAVINTATCLRTVIEKSRADGIFLVDNQQLLEGNLGSGATLARINKRIVDPFMDILCVGEESGRFVGEMLDANDFIRGVKGISSIGIGYVSLPKKSLLNFSKSGGVQDIKVTKDRNNRAQNAVESAFSNLSIRCENNVEGGARYDASKVLVLLSGPKDEVTHEALEIADMACIQRVPGSSRKKGTYPGRTSNSISATVIVSGIGEGAAMDTVQMYYKKALEMLDKGMTRQERSEGSWGKVSEAGKGLPDL